MQLCGLVTEFLNITLMNLGFRGLSDPINIFKLANNDNTLDTSHIQNFIYW
jgi:hypothetical protein